MDSVIRVWDLWKRYLLGTAPVGAQTLYELLATQLAARGKAGNRPRPRRQEIWALQSVELEVPRGEVLAIVGKNGSGKSTLLKVLARITPPTRGRVEFRGRVASLLEVGTGFHPELTGRENIYLNGAILGMKRSEIARRFDAIVAFAGVERFLDTPVKRYSSGMYVRLAFAVAAHLEADILLIDEVLAVGDAEFQQRCLAKMEEVRKQDRTVLFVSHQLSAVRRLCSAALLLDSGRVVARGSVQEVLERYLGGERHPAQQSWSDPATAPGSERVKLASVAVRAPGQAGAEVPSDVSIRIEVEFWILQGPLRELCIDLQIKDLFGTIVFETANTRAASLNRSTWFLEDHEPGRYRATCEIPANFLNDLTYRVSVFAVILSPFSVEAAVEDAVEFHVRDTGFLREPGRGGTWNGLVRVPFFWETERLAD
jgi:lipopolysaccharide transport system ATP-binding protein